MDILLVMPWEDTYRSYRDVFSPLLVYTPLTLTTLAALIPEDLGARVEICDEIGDKAHRRKKHYDIVAISFCTPSSRKAYELAREFRDRGSHVVLGGYHATSMPEEALEHGDTVIVGAAEVAWPRFLYDFKGGKPARRYECRHIEGNSFVMPKRELLRSRKYMRIPTMLANNGCRNRCDYCSIGHMWEANPRPVEKVIDEIRSLKTNKLIFFDPNFFQNRDYALELLRELEKLKIRWACNATVGNAFDPEVMHWAKRGGCIGVLLGLESFKKESLMAVKKGFNDPNRYKEAIETIQKHGISVNGCFVLGFDSDREEDLLAMPEQVAQLRLNLARFAILTPFPNTALFNKLDSEGRILTREWHRYTQNQVVFQPKNMSPKRLQEIYRKVWRDTYKIQNVFKRISHIPESDLLVKFVMLGANIAFKYLGDHIKE